MKLKYKRMVYIKEVIMITRIYNGNNDKVIFFIEYVLDERRTGEVKITAVIKK